MSSCCSHSLSQDAYPSKGKCPINGKLYSLVSTETISKHLKAPWNWTEKKQAYYFCDDKDCDVVYFGADNSIINRGQLRTKVGIKENSNTQLLCYCYGISFAEAKLNSHLKSYIIEKTKHQQCACDAMNPSGRCCLKDFEN